MHELSLVQSIVEQVEQQVKLNDGNAVERIELEIGRLSGVELSSFEFAWDPTVQNTLLENAERVIHVIAAEACCSDCNALFEKLTLYDACPQCGGYVHDLNSGKELKVKSIVIH